jgi:hypothetical protein
MALEARPWTSYLWRWLLCTLFYLVGAMIGGALLARLGVAQPPLAHPIERTVLMRNFLVGALLLAAGVAPLAQGLEGRWRTRWLAWSALVWIAVSVNTVIEARIFITAFAHGGALDAAIYALPPSLTLGVALATWFYRDTEDASAVRIGDFFARRGVASWVWRLVAAWLAFPAVYLFFGVIISPIVMPYYRDPALGLVIPGFGTMIPTQLVRSALLLAVSLPLVALWRGTRARLFLTLGLAYSVMIGWFGLLQATWLPMTLRITHSIEIGADSFVYALILVVLLGSWDGLGQGTPGTTTAA